MNDARKNLATLLQASAGDELRRASRFLVLIAALCLASILLSHAASEPAAVSGPSISPAVYARTELGTGVLTRTVLLPLVINGQQPAISVNPRDRQSSADFYSRVYLASEGIPAAWTGSHATCDAGTTADAFREAVQLRINYFRAMAGIPGEVLLSDEYNRKAQQAALMMSANGQLNHNPPSTWVCYTEEGKEAAGSSNLYLGVYGPAAITGYMMDPGSGNYAVGHRRWILYPQTQSMGTGDIPSTEDFWASNTLWVFDENMWGPRPQTREEYVAWPPPGYVPYQVVFSRWSFAYAQADFTSATVEMSTAGHSVPVNVQPVVNGYGENTLVWEPDASFSTPPQADVAYSVTVRHVGIGGTFRDFSYQVIVFDPGTTTAALFGGAEGVLGTPPESP